MKCYEIQVTMTTETRDTSKMAPHYQPGIAHITKFRHQVSKQTYLLTYNQSSDF